MAVEVVQHAMRASSRLHREESARLEPGPIAWMLLFYSVECGLKAELMKRRGLRNTAQIDDHLRTHELRDLAKELNLSSRLQQALKPCGRKHDDSTVAVRDLHAAWRYGAALDMDGETSAVKALKELSEWCRSILGG